jgi:hypothetical protein
MICSDTVGDTELGEFTFPLAGQGIQVGVVDMMRAVSY